MANITKRGNGYRITVSCGYDINGRQIRKYKTWTPEEGMTARQIEKELNRQAVLFEEQVQTGQCLDGNITLADFAERWFKDYAPMHLKPKTLEGYKILLPRILQALGHIKLEKLRPPQIQEFYNNLCEKGIRLDTKYKAADNFKNIIKRCGYNQKTLAAAAGVSESTVRMCCIGNNVSKASADKIMDVLKVKDLFISQAADKPLADNTVAKYHRVLSSMLSTAVRWQMIFSNPCARVKPPQIRYKEAAALDEKGAAELINCLDSEPTNYKTAVMLILYTGMRRGEVCGLNWSDIDFENNLIHIQRTLNYTVAKGLYEDTPKTKQSVRVIRIADYMTELLKAHKREQLARRLELGTQWTQTDKVFTSPCGGLLRPDTFSAWFHKFVQKNNLPDIHLHSLRHTSATLLIAGGADVVTVSHRLGHANKSTTLNIYSHAVMAADDRAADMLGNILNSSDIYNKKSG